MHKFTSKLITKSALPLVVEPHDRRMSHNEFFELLKENKEELRKNLLKHGGLLLRNFPIQNEEDFAAVLKTLGMGKFKDYIGGDSPRKKLKDGIYTSTEAPPSVKIPLHNELSFVKNYPRYIHFFCVTPPAEKGETIIGDARKIYDSIDNDVKKRFIDKGLRYVSCYYNNNKFMEFVNKYQKFHRNWIDVFETTDKEEVEKKCRENEFDFKWNKNDWLQISQKRPAVISHPETDEKVWFNQAHLFDFNPKLLKSWWRYVGAKIFYARKHTRLHEVYFGDNSPIPREDFYHILDILDQNTLAFPWQKGDLMILDNILSMHGRATFTGKRRVLASMTD